jgi:hypothetical protein
VTAADALDFVLAVWSVAVALGLFVALVTTRGGD